MSRLPPTRWAGLSRSQARVTLAVLGIVYLLGVWQSWQAGRNPNLEPEAVSTSPKDDETAPDLKLYRELIAAVRAGENYYDVARQKLPVFGFPIGSVFNWRLPTYAYVLALLPTPGTIQAVLAGLGILGLILNFQAECAEVRLLLAAGTTILLAFIVSWAFAGEAFYAQELWAAFLMIVSIGALGVRWHLVSIIVGLAALFFRELVLPYCLVSTGWAWWQGRRRDAILGAVGIAAFLAFFAWHAGQMHERIANVPAGQGSGVESWLRFGGLDFVILTGRMNPLLYNAPGWVIFTYLFLALVGLAGMSGERGNILFSTTVIYLLAFCFVGHRLNMYWGLMYSGLLPIGLMRSPLAFRDLIGRPVAGSGENAE